MHEPILVSRWVEELVTLFERRVNIDEDGFVFSDWLFIGVEFVFLRMRNNMVKTTVDSQQDQGKQILSW